jgi:anti-sigma B factor antagonist
MQEQPVRIVASDVDGVTVVEFKDQDILDEVNIAQIGQQLQQLADKQDEPKLVLDFSHVAHMSSAALGMLITLHKHIRERDGQLRLCSIRPEIYEVFVITKLNEIFQIHEDRAAALASLNG